MMLIGGLEAVFYSKLFHCNLNVAMVSETAIISV